MKSVILITAIFLSCVNVSYASAEQDDPIKNPPPVNPGGRPTAPALKRVSVEIVDGYVYISMVIPEGKCIVSVMGNNIPAQTIVFDSNAPLPIYIGEDNSASITICTELGNTYCVNI